MNIQRRYLGLEIIKRQRQFEIRLGFVYFGGHTTVLPSGRRSVHLGVAMIVWPERS